MSSSQPTPSATRLLIVDDNAATRGALETAARASTFFSHVTTAEDGRVALDGLIRLGSDDVARLPHVILVDLYMPRMNGVELLCAVRGNPLLRAIKRVVISGWDGPEERNASYLAGCHLFLKKPGVGLPFTPLIQLVAAMDLGLPRRAAAVPLGGEGLGFIPVAPV